MSGAYALDAGVSRWHAEPSAGSSLAVKGSVRMCTVFSYTRETTQVCLLAFEPAASGRKQAS